MCVGRHGPLTNMSNEFFGQDKNHPSLVLLRPFINAFHSGKQAGPNGRNEILASRVLRNVAEAVEAYEGNFENWKETHLLSDILKAVGEGLDHGLSIARNGHFIASQVKERNRDAGNPS